MNSVINYYKQHPLTSILFIAFIVRMFSVIFAKGYGMHDDHFLIIETSRSWVEGWDFQGWLQTSPQGHSFTYPLLMYLLFRFLCFIGIESLDIQMYFIRFIHALLSLLTVYFSYKIVFRATNEKKLANITGWFLALLWCMPWLSVRNLVEIVCMPFLLWSVWIYFRNQSPRNYDAIYSGAIMGLAFAFRFQVIFFIGGMGLAMLIYKQFKQAILWTVALLIVFSITQISDIFLWHRPFAEMQEYIVYNFTNAGDYPQGGFFKYFGVLLGILLPPISIFLLFGFFYSYKKLLLFLPTFAFLIFHSIFPNKQERFIFPVIPFIVLLGIIGCYDFYIKKALTLKQRKIIKTCIIISAVLNTILLVPITVHYSKKSRVESMVYLYKYHPNVKTFIYEDTYHNDWEWMPRTYTVQNCKQINITSDTVDIQQLAKDNQPDFILFADNKNLQQRVAKMQTYFPNLTYKTTVTPSFIDNLMEQINRHNHNYKYYIYYNNDALN